MEEIRFCTVQEFNDHYGVPTLHPLVTVVRFNREAKLEEHMYHYGLYALFLKENKGCRLSYGRTEYDFDEMTVTSFAPGQSIHVEPNPEVPVPKWTALLFQPDLLNRTQLGKNIGRYEFFDYTSNEALHLSCGEIEIYRGVLAMIQQELERGIDKHSRELIVSNIELLLNYCLRFYERQFITRSNVNHDILARFERLLDDYFAGDRAQREGLPSVKWCAGELCLSPNYFGDLIKKETGKSAQEYIQLKLIATAKERILAPDKTIGQVAYELGFQYPQHFTRLFKKITGLTPNEYRSAEHPAS